jgi:hypothetical protein
MALRLQYGQARFDLDKLKATPLVVHQAAKSVAFVRCRATGSDRLHDCADSCREVCSRIDRGRSGSSTGRPLRAGHTRLKMISIA